MFADDTCMNVADDISCTAMTELAMKQYLQNQKGLLYQTNFPACERFLQLADREEEHRLQKPLTTAKKMCFTKNDDYQAGEWTRMFDPIYGQLPKDTPNRCILPNQASNGKNDVSISSNRSKTQNPTMLAGVPGIFDIWTKAK